MKPTVDFVAMARSESKAALSLWDEAERNLQQERILDTTHRLMINYTGTFYCSQLCMTLEVKLGHPGLRLQVNGLKDQKFTLRHYHHDTWTFFPESREMCLRKGLGGYLRVWRSFLLSFEGFYEGHFRGVKWERAERDAPPFEFLRNLECYFYRCRSYTLLDIS